VNIWIKKHPQMLSYGGYHGTLRYLVWHMFGLMSDRYSFESEGIYCFAVIFKLKLMINTLKYDNFLKWRQLFDFATGVMAPSKPLIIYIWSTFCRKVTMYFYLTFKTSLVREMCISSLPLIIRNGHSFLCNFRSI
jgi:hypothetical protein